MAAKQRETLLRNTPDVIEELTAEERANAPYIAKMIMAGSVGLFDAALNYLWNETINRLRDHVAAFDVDYFFDLAETDPARRKNLKTREDLSQIDDYKLLEAANKIKLISDIGFKQLTHINYMRNHASAAHPNIEELTGLKLAEWLETCIKEVFWIQPRNVVAAIGKLLSNIKSKRLPKDELKKAAAFFDWLEEDQTDNLAAGLFGIYAPADATPEILDNVRSLWPGLWPLSARTPATRSASSSPGSPPTPTPTGRSAPGNCWTWSAGPPTSPSPSASPRFSRPWTTSGRPTRHTCATSPRSRPPHGDSRTSSAATETFPSRSHAATSATWSMSS